jgi:hypothetical protein
MNKTVFKVFAFYRDGFRAMRTGRTLWTIILIKLIIVFGFLKIFFFPDYLQSNFSTDEERASHVSQSLTKRNSNR